MAYVFGMGRCIEGTSRNATYNRAGRYILDHYRTGPDTGSRAYAYVIDNAYSRTYIDIITYYGSLTVDI